jgi:pyruvate/2-oxoglutarate dehydrogenase complex dihydrolipoamide acyltransferase (E2) component
VKPVHVPTSDVNSESGVVTSWLVGNGTPVDGGVVIVEVETSKALLEVTAPETGVLLHLAAEGQEVALSRPVALLFPDKDALLTYEQDQRRGATESAAAGDAPRASVKAVQRAEELGIDLAAIHSEGLITVQDVEKAAASASTADYSAMPAPLATPRGIRRILLIGGGLGATQVIDIFAQTSRDQAVAILDDSRDKWGTVMGGVPVVGGTDRLAQLFADGACDAAVIAISTSVPARRMFREVCADAGIPLTNVIDRTAKIATGVVLGVGNIICAFCHFGTEVRVGDNNFFSAYNSFDHHSEIGSDCSTGPGCMSSGLVRLGDGIRLGTGIFIEPGLELGDGVQVASGAVLVHSVPADHAVKTRIFTTAVVPVRR